MMAPHQQESGHPPKKWMAHFLKDLRFAQLQLLQLLLLVLWGDGGTGLEMITSLNFPRSRCSMMISGQGSETMSLRKTMSLLFTATTKFNSVFGSTYILYTCGSKANHYIASHSSEV